MQPSGDLTTTGQNISNASTPGYSIETPVYAETGGQYTGSGYLPQGVSTTTVQRQYSQYLTTELNNAQIVEQRAVAYNTMISQLNNLVGSPTAGIASAITGYFTGLQNVQRRVQPGDAPDRDERRADAREPDQRGGPAVRPVAPERQHAAGQHRHADQQLHAADRAAEHADRRGQHARPAAEPVARSARSRGVEPVATDRRERRATATAATACSWQRPAARVRRQQLSARHGAFAGDPSELSVQYLGQAGANPAPTPQNAARQQDRRRHARRPAAVPQPDARSGRGATRRDRRPASPRR